MPDPKSPSTPFVETPNPGSGPPIGTLRCTTDVPFGRNSIAKTTPTTTGDVGFSTGVRMSEVTTTVAATVGSQQHKNLIALYESQLPFDFKVNDGVAMHPGTGVIDSLSVSSKTNEVIEYSIKISAADGKSS